MLKYISIFLGKEGISDQFGFLLKCTNWLWIDKKRKEKKVTKNISDL